jgi:preprotein translocase subunit SecF
MIDFLKYKFIYFVISAAVIGAGLISVATGGLKYSVEFTGGTNIEYKVGRQDKVFKVKTKPLEPKEEVEFKKKLENKHKNKITVIKSETVGPILGKELIRKTIAAAILGALVILIYITFAFRNFNFALSAIGALVHDILVVIGVYSFFNRFYGAEVDTLFVTALLTTMSFSVHDTIVIFDKIREYRREVGISNLEFYFNKALTETMVRSLNNSMTIVFMLLALILLGGSTIKFFIIALLIGTITGTYSSPFIATPLLLLLERKKVK